MALKICYKWELVNQQTVFLNQAPGRKYKEDVMKSLKMKDFAAGGIFLLGMLSYSAHAQLAHFLQADGSMVEALTLFVWIVGGILLIGCIASVALEAAEPQKTNLQFGQANKSIKPCHVCEAERAQKAKFEPVKKRAPFIG